MRCVWPKVTQPLSGPMPLVICEALFTFGLLALSASWFSIKCRGTKKVVMMPRVAAFLEYWLFQFSTLQNLSRFRKFRCIRNRWAALKLEKFIYLFLLNLCILSLLRLKLHSYAYFIEKSVVLNPLEGPELRTHFWVDREGGKRCTRQDSSLPPLCYELCFNCCP